MVAETLLETLPEQLVWLLHQSRSLVASREVATLVNISLDALLQLTQAERAFFFELDASSRRPVMHSGKSRSGEKLHAVDNKVQSAVGQALADRRSIIVTDSEGRGGDDAASRTLAGLRAKLLCCLPLLSDGEPIGILYADGKNRPDKNLPTRVLELLGEHVAVCLDNARMFERATGDLLTGLPNNSYFLFHLGRAVQLAGAERQGGVLMLDVDAFKRVNVAAGAEMGDRALVDIAHTLHEVLSADGLLARYGSDKFAVLLPPDEHVKVALRLRDVAERARAAISTKSFHGISMSISIGGVAFPGPKAQKPQEIVAMADDVLRRARSRGAAQIEVATT